MELVTNMKSKKLFGSLLTFMMTWALTAFPVSSSHATIFWDDGFESGNTGFQLVAGMSYTPNPLVSGSQALQMFYCGPTPDTQCGTGTSRAQPPSEHHWMRVYIRLHDFTPGSITSKMISVAGNGVYPSYWWLIGMWGTLNFAVTAQGIIDSNGVPATVNFYSSHTWQQDRWYCLETHIQNNTPGQPNGIIEAWVDGQQVLYVPNLTLRAGTQTAVAPGLYNQPTQRFETVAHYVQHGMGYVYYDNHAVGDQRIGCSASVPKGDTTPPAVPTGLRAN